MGSQSGGDGKAAAGSGRQGAARAPPGTACSSHLTLSPAAALPAGCGSESAAVVERSAEVDACRSPGRGPAAPPPPPPLSPPEVTLQLQETATSPPADSLQSNLAGPAAGGQMVRQAARRSAQVACAAPAVAAHASAAARSRVAERRIIQRVLGATELQIRSTSEEKAGVRGAAFAANAARLRLQEVAAAGSFRHSHPTSRPLSCAQPFAFAFRTSTQPCAPQAWLSRACCCSWRPPPSRWRARRAAATAAAGRPSGAPSSAGSAKTSAGT